MNRIKKVLESRGIEKMKPTNTLLDDLGISLHMWNKWVENKRDPELTQLVKIASFLGCEINELIHQEKERRKMA